MFALFLDGLSQAEKSVYNEPGQCPLGIAREGNQAHIAMATRNLTPDFPNGDMAL